MRILHAVHVHLPDEFTIELDEVRAEPVHEVERRPPGTEVVERHPEAILPVCIEDLLEV